MTEPGGRSVGLDAQERSVGVAEPLPGGRGRRIVSFARTDARLQPKDARAIERYGSAHLLDVDRAEARTSVAPSARLDAGAVFGRVAPLVVEIGCGSGDAVVAAAEAHPDWNVLGVEVYRPGLWDMLRKVGSRGLDNVRLLEADAVPVCETWLPEGSVRELWTFFPDPWPKKRHHKRRLVSPAFARLAARVIEPGGLWRLATDWSDYGEQMREVLDGSSEFVNVHGGSGGSGYDAVGAGAAPRFEGRPLTRFERRGIAEGREILDLTYRRV
ncbi:tRNA (guanosine(46)-N7)-methyltransferase TrmB [Arsenicicoccus piscis]|uniref:tRNA (guanine-N(7)-)-methyltransferase n=1 Tax=Arsenicicoccus piscis TaxID=673954 RepID=A0ABQ6HRA8_9MICO|nr:tRNA (guanosine(46)-N7)-methyltransferase TrmB [Arsenicicoccus piscis]MCH8628860.1 tRNA (guanosine(46)-N7)-methyltransferase TrmB [Arsenicicoccus piscis]GMA20085.1 tRNA (guanine-N(7)-)-methyltransferase [Arsenicicoccus piscis]